jgi:hypothetical protein
VTTGDRSGGLTAWWQSVAEASRQLDEALAAIGRPDADVSRYLSMDASGTFALTSKDYFDDAVGRAGQLGFTDVITHWPRPEGPYAGKESALEEVAARLG